MSEQKLTVLEWCDQQVTEGKELSIGWEGGGDNGYAFFKIDGKDIDNEYTEVLLDHIYDELDYGSWAGEFSASGEAIYSSETKCFEGTDYCANEEYIKYECDIKVKVPKDFSFEEIIFECEDRGVRVYVKTELEECASYIRDIKTDFNTQFDEVVKEFENEGYEFLGAYFEEETFRSEYVLEGDFLTFEINSVNMRYEEMEEKNIVLDVSEIK
jgi:hypothetical protein